MKIFIDSADLAQIIEAFSWGIVDGITTNPSLIKKAVEKTKASGERVSLDDYIRRVLETAGDAPVSLEVIGTTEAEMTAQGQELYRRFNPVANNVVVKIPVNPGCDPHHPGRYDGLKAIQALASEGIPVNTTLIFTPEQAMLAAKAGAAYVSPFAGRIDDDLRAKAGMPPAKSDYFPAEGVCQNGATIDDGGIVSGVDLIEQTVALFARHHIECEVLAASLRHPRQVRECAIAGADVATIPFEVLREMLEHKKTVEGMRAFVADVVPEYAEIFRKGGRG